jgi:hypothetical protein
MRIMMSCVPLCDQQGEERRQHHADLHDQLAVEMVGDPRGGEPAHHHHQGWRHGQPADFRPGQV